MMEIWSCTSGRNRNVCSQMVLGLLRRFLTGETIFTQGEPCSCHQAPKQGCKEESAELPARGCSFPIHTAAKSRVQCQFHCWLNDSISQKLLENPYCFVLFLISTFLLPQRFFFFKSLKKKKKKTFLTWFHPSGRISKCLGPRPPGPVEPMLVW